MKAQQFFLVVAIDTGYKFRERVGRWHVRAARSLWLECEAKWKPKAIALAKAQGFELGDRWSRWPAGWEHKACIYGATDFRRKGVVSRCTPPYYFPARPVS